MVKTRILIVEDERIVAEDTKTILEDFGYDVCGVFGAGSDVLSNLAELRPDLVLMDIALKGEMDGIETAGKIRSTHDVTVVYLTAHGDEATLERAKLTEPYGYVLKPFTGAELRSTIEMALFKHQAELRLKHLNAVLLAVRNVNQLIVREKDVRSLLQGICDCLVETRGYHNAWIAVLDQSGEVTEQVAAGFDGSFAPMAEQLGRGELPRCAERALAGDGVVTIRDVSAHCAGCPLRDVYLPRGVLARKLEHRGRLYGILIVSTPVEFVGSAQEVSLFDEIGADVALALYALGMEEERREAEARLRESEERFRLLVESSADHIFMLDREGRYLFSNDRVAQFVLEGGDSLVGRKLSDLYEADDLAHYERQFQSVLATGASVTFEHEIPAADGVRHHVDTLYPIRRGDELWAVGGICHDITQRKQAELALAAEKARLDVTVRSIGDGVIVTDAGGKIVLMNRVAEDLTGWPEEEAVPKPLADVFQIISEETRQACENPVDKVLETGLVVGLANRTVLVARDGTERIIADSGAPIRPEPGANVVGVVLVFRDVTEERRIREELEKVEKLESLGIVAGGIAHDFNNMLGGILGCVSLARDGLDPADERTRDRLNRAEKACLEATELTRRMLTFAKGGAPVTEIVSVAELIDQTVAFALRGSNVVAEMVVPESLWSVEADPGQVSQVVSNLVINAKQAMPAGGVLTVRAGNVELAKEEVPPLEPGVYVKVSFEDRGTGIPHELLPRVFDPYFTTKHEGSGLGLATCYSILRRHDGHVTAESRPGTGSTFSIYLPATGKPAPAVDPAPAEAPTPGEGRILIMDDEDSIRLATGEWLTIKGYEVAEARDGAEALRLHQEAAAAGRPFDVVILDLTVRAGMGGAETMAKLLERDPEVKCIVASGYSNDAAMADFARYGFSAAVAKPFRLADLTAVVKRLMRA